MHVLIWLSYFKRHAKLKRMECMPALGKNAHGIFPSLNLPKNLYADMPNTP